MLRQRLYAQRTIIGVVAALCLLLHVMLPTLVNLSLVPKLLYMPTHCPSSAVQNVSLHQQSFHQQPMHAAKMRRDDGMMMQHHHMHMQHGTHEMQSAKQARNPHHGHTLSSADVSSLLFSASEVQQIVELAQQLMKHCPLCSHGLEGAVLAPMLLLLVLVLLRCFVPVLRTQAAWFQRFYASQPHYSWPYKHGPPLAL